MSRVAAMTAGVRSLPEKGGTIGDDSAGPSGDAFNSILSGFGGKGGAGAKSPAPDDASKPITSPEGSRAAATSENATTSAASSSSSRAATLITLFAGVSKAAPFAGTPIQVQIPETTKPTTDAKTSEADTPAYPAPIAAPRVDSSPPAPVDCVMPAKPVAASVTQASEADAPVYPVPQAASGTDAQTPASVDRVMAGRPIAVVVEDKPSAATGNAASGLIAFLQTGLRIDKDDGIKLDAVASAPSPVSPPSVKAGAGKRAAGATDAAPPSTSSVDQNAVAVMALASMIGGLPPPPSPRPATVTPPKSGIPATDPVTPAASKIARLEQPIERTSLEPKAVVPSNPFAGRSTTSDEDAKAGVSLPSGTTSKAAAAVDTIVMNVSSIGTATHFLPVGFAAPMQQIADAVTTATSPDSSAQASGVTTASGTAGAGDVVKAAGPLKTLTIGLEPENLGSVSVSMRVSGNRLDIEIEASRPETTRLIGKDKDVLSQTLQSSGYSLESLVVKSAASSGTDTGTGSTGGQQQPSSGDSNAQSSFGQSRDPEGRRPPSQFAGNPGSGASGGSGTVSPSRDGRDGVYL